MNPSNKILVALVNHVYKQIFMALLASTFCASILFIGLYDNPKIHSLLWLWFFVFIMITLFRLSMFTLYQYTFTDKKVNFWRLQYIIGSCLGGASWGLVSLFLLPQATQLEQTLIIVMIAGVTAGAVPLSAAIPAAAIGFLVFSVGPLIIALGMFKTSIYFLFNAAIVIYFIYSIIITIRNYHLIKNTTVLQFENVELVDKLELTNVKLEHAATHDPLTQVANRTLFSSKLKDAIENAKKNKRLLALFYLDLDNFKLANDKYGHAIGDYILKVIIKRLIRFFRKEDVIARLGGDELAIIIDNANSLDEVKVIAQKICHLIALPIEIPDATLMMKASIGISLHPYDGKDEETLLKCADQCMYLAKKQGGNRFCFSEELNQETKIR